MAKRMPSDRIWRIAVIARDWLSESRAREHGFTNRNIGLAPFFSEIARCCSAQRADLLLFCLWTHSEDDDGRLAKHQLFPAGTTHRVVIVEVTRKGKEWMELWHRAHRSPVRFLQCFSRSSESRDKKLRFMRDLDQRQLGRLLIIICGESNIVNTRRGAGIVDAFHIREQLKRRGVRVILNPIHDYMRRYEMSRKRAALSRWTQVMVSVWNRGSKGGAEARLPWQLHVGGRRADAWIREVVEPVSGQPGVRVGMLDLRALRNFTAVRRRKFAVPDDK
jgi:hypothetical protein